MLKFKVAPPNLTPWLTSEERERNILLVDMQIDHEKSQELRFDLDIAFDPISVRVGKTLRKDYYIGCTGAEIVFSVNHGNKIISYTKGSTLNVEYKNENEFSRNSSLDLAPDINIKNGNNESNLKLLSLKYEKSKRVVFSANFNSNERILEPIHLDNVIKWQINLPRSAQVIRDYLLGNLYLFATCEKSNGDLHGAIKIKPSDVRFFGPNRSPLSSKKSIFMRYILYKKGIKIDNIDGMEIKFNQKKHEE